MKDTGFKITVPKLKRKSRFLEQKETISSALGSKRLKHYLCYDVQKPIWVELGDPNNGQQNIQGRDGNMLPSRLYEVVANFPVYLNKGLNTRKNEQRSTLQSDSPVDTDLDNRRHQSDLFPIYKEEKEWDEARISQVEEIEKVRTIV